MDKIFAFLKPFLIGLCTSALGFLMPIAKFLLLVSSMVVADYFTGTRAARHRGEVINSKGMRRTIEKIVMYFVGILLSEGLTWTFSLPRFGDLSLTFTVSAFICATEFRSNLENISSYTGNDLWAKLVSNFPDLTKWILPPKTKQFKDEVEPKQ